MVAISPHELSGRTLIMEDATLTTLTPRFLSHRAEALNLLVSEECARLMRNGEWHAGTDHGAARYISDAKELDAIRRSEPATLKNLYPGTVLADWTMEAAMELMGRIANYWNVKEDN
jgi:hypothetical protein